MPSGVNFREAPMAGCFIASVPIAVLYTFFVDRFIAGFTVGAIKYDSPWPPLHGNREAGWPSRPFRQGRGASERFAQ